MSNFPRLSVVSTQYQGRLLHNHPYPLLGFAFSSSASLCDHSRHWFHFPAPWFDQTRELCSRNLDIQSIECWPTCRSRRRSAKGRSTCRGRWYHLRGSPCGSTLNSLPCRTWEVPRRHHRCSIHLRELKLK